MKIENELVRFSRAGDVFHYRWAARRCLRLIYPKSPLQSIVIEGSKERDRAGEYVIDVAEYSRPLEDGQQKIAYFQLKHTTVRKKNPFNLSDLKDTIKGFTERYFDLFLSENRHQSESNVTFCIVSNRPIAGNFKRDIRIISEGGTVNARFQKTIENYTNLKGKNLEKFCESLEVADGEGDYNAQRFELHAEISQLLVGTVDNSLIENIIALVQDRVLPHSKGQIIREDILMRFGVTSERMLYPAPSEIEEIENAIFCKQHKIMLDCILKSTAPVIIHAPGGVGKSIFARQISQILPNDSIGVVYDCFGGGKYRNRSEPRHRHRDGLVQIANELASIGLCMPLIIQDSALYDSIVRSFLDRLKTAANSLRKTNEKAILMILIDAADNAEMAAKEFGESCFINELLRESLPDGCRLIALCRTERIHLLEPSDSILRLKLEPFSIEETLIHLRRHFQEASESDGLEFYRLSNNGNPRVQANALSSRFDTISETLESLGPSGTSVEKQIETQLNSAISTIKDLFSTDYRKHIEEICYGLANLPPFIPLFVLAKAANVDQAQVKSFIADLGRPLWFTDTYVHFRDEPTESWFRKKFPATDNRMKSYVNRLKLLAEEYTYVAETLPSLFLQAGMYNELIKLALSDDFLPENDPINERNVRVYRLQFAFKAALKQKKYNEAVKLALRAGEELAGAKRQLELLKENIDLIAPLQSEQKIQELAFRQTLRGNWKGSGNVYSAALLSSVADFKGEARGYLRSSNNWLRVYFEEEINREDKNSQDDLKEEDLVELAFTTYNLDGVNKTLEFIQKWKPRQVIYSVAKSFIRRLIDAGNFAAVDEILRIEIKQQYCVIAISHELIEVGRFPTSKLLENCLISLASKHTRIPKPINSGHFYNHINTSSIVSFLEACVAKELPGTLILRALRYYVPLRADRTVSSDFHGKGRDVFLRAVSLRCVLTGNIQPNTDELIPEELLENVDDYMSKQNINEFKQIVEGLLPWYIVRARILNNDVDDIFQIVENAKEQSKLALRSGLREFVSMAYEISKMQINILTICKTMDSKQIEKYYENYLKENRKIDLEDRIAAIRCFCRCDKFSVIRNRLEQTVYDMIALNSNDDPETKANLYIKLARAVLPVSREDAAAYFECAIQAVSKFGDEIADRWRAVAAIANRSADSGFSSPETAYRFIRCAEMVGENVYKENYWDRNEAMQICTRLSPKSALAALSRWHDRDVGWFKETISSLADELVRSEYISPSAGWSLSVFFSKEKLVDFASLCIEKELSSLNRQYILDSVVSDLRFSESKEIQSWEEIKQVAEKYSKENAELEKVFAFFNEHPEMNSRDKYQNVSNSNIQVKKKSIEWEKVFEECELTSSSGIDDAIRKFKAIEGSDHIGKNFWEEVFRQINDCDACKFLISLTDAENVSFLDMPGAFAQIPNAWKTKISVKRILKNIFKKIARRFARSFVTYDGVGFFLKNSRFDANIIPFLREGIMEGFSNMSDLVNAANFFGFCEIASVLIAPEQATDLLDFGLKRFEMHIDDDYADGCWANWLNPPTSINMAFSGFIWAALGSPRAETRWRAAHCVRRLADLGCKNEIDSLLNWMVLDRVDAFGSQDFPFYNLHARQYLLIALARVSLDNRSILKHHHEIFLDNALTSIHGILIQKFSAEIALNIESAFPNTYGKADFEQLQKIGVSQLPLKELKGYGESIESYWHRKGVVDTSLKFHFDYDIGSYWYEPLGNVFGINGRQVEELAAGVLINEWGVKTDNGHIRDPRNGIWNSGLETSHSHGSYPRVDNYSFYLSYHAMFIVAAKLLKRMPVIHHRDWDEDNWLEWLHRHTLSRGDGRWLADRRDPAPLLRRDWIFLKDNKDWSSLIVDDDFLDGLLSERDKNSWINVFGCWQEGDYYREESYYISSALVSPASSQSLLNALTYCPNQHSFKLPAYYESDMEYKIFPFELKGWIGREDTGKEVDEYDPHAGEINFPPYQVGLSIAERIGLKSDLEKREWFLGNEANASMQCELWCTDRPGRDREPLRSGNRLRCSLALLKKICSLLDYEIIIRVEITRQYKRDYGRDEDETSYKTHNKIYIFSADGRLRDTETDYQLRESTG